MKKRFSKQIDFIRNIRGNDIDLMNHFFNKILYIIPILFNLLFILFIYLFIILFIYLSFFFICLFA